MEVTTSVDRKGPAPVSAARQTEPDRGRADELALATEAQGLGRFGWWRLELPRMTVSWSPGVAGVLGLDAGSPDGTFEGFLDLVHPSDRPRVDRVLRDAVRTGDGFDVEHRVRRSVPGDLWVRQRGRVETDDDGAAIGVIGIVQDVTDYKLRMMELQHRVMNSLTIIAVELDEGASRLTDETAIAVIEAAESRIQSIRAIYERLLVSDDSVTVDFDLYVSDVAQIAVETYSTRSSDVRLAVRTDPVRLDTRRSGTLGLILNELITNALKYAYPTAGGEVRVLLREREGVVTLTVEDDGVGLPAGFSVAGATTVGYRLLRTLAAQIGADLRVESDGGTSVSTSFSYGRPAQPGV